MILLRRPGWLLVVLLAAACGCAEIRVRPAAEYSIVDVAEAGFGSGDTLSPRTLLTLRQLDFEQLYHDNPADVFLRLQAETERDPHPDLLFALAELSHQLGQHAEQSADPNACVYHYLCAGYAFHFLFGNDTGSPFDPRFRLACDLYNDALMRCIRTAQHAGRLDPRQQLHLPMPDGQVFTLTIQHHGFAWGPEEFGPLEFCADYTVVGLANQYRSYGLGVPLIGTRTASRTTARHAYYPDAVNFPVTAFFRFDGGVADLRDQHAGTLELHNPLTMARVAVRGRSVPLQSDLSTPLAYFLSHTDLQTTDLRGFLRPDTVEVRSGIYMFEPYQPGKIPVLMVHGLLSSPLTWAPLFNDLRADPELRSRYQFWFYLYPTGPGYLQAAADLRQDLAQLRRELDPAGTDRSLERMVLVGHSMGGLVSHLLTADSGEDFRRLVSQKPLEEVPLDTDARRELRQLFYFERQPWVGRVIYIGTPHHGSKLSPSTPGRLAAWFVELPTNMLKSAQELMQANPNAWGALGGGQLPTSVDLLAPGSPALELLAARPRPVGVPFHSIIGEALPRTLVRELTRPIVGNEKSDGVVPYSSAHLSDVESELIVPADHFHVHQHPLAVREVRRILLEHLNAVRATSEEMKGLADWK